MITETNYQLIVGINGYTPKDRHFTSEEEISYLTEKLRLKEMTPLELQNLRDMVVLMYNNRMENAETNDVKMELMNSMQSITTVIDTEKWSR